MENVTYFCYFRANCGLSGTLRGCPSECEAPAQRSHGERRKRPDSPPEKGNPDKGREPEPAACHPPLSPFVPHFIDLVVFETSGS